MGDPFSIATAGIGLAGPAVQVIQACRALHGLWQDVKDVPERIGRLLEEIELMTIVFASTERNATGFSTYVVHDDRLLSKIVGLSLRAMNDLERLVKDLAGEIHAKKRMTKLAARVRVVLKEDQLTKYEQRLKNVLDLLILAQQSYSVIQQLHYSEQNSQLEPLLRTISTRTELLVAALPCDTATPDADNMAASRKKQPLENSEAALVCLGPTTKMSLKVPQWLIQKTWDVPSSRSRYPELPAWLTERVWVNCFSKSAVGWQHTFRVDNIVPFQADILRQAYDGNYSNITDLFDTRSASPLDVDADGWSLVDWAIAGPSSLDAVKFLYSQGIRPRKHDGDRISPLTGLARQGDPQKLLFALSLSYQEPAHESARQYTTAMVMAAVTDDNMFDTALRVIGADYYYDIPLWIRLSYLTVHTPRKIVYRIISRYTRHNDQIIPAAIQRAVDAFSEKYTVLDTALNGYWDPMYCMIEARTIWSQFEPQRLCNLQQSWQKSVAEVVSATGRETDLPYPEGSLSIFSALRTWDCPSLSPTKRDGLLSAIKGWMEAVEESGIDLGSYSNNILDLLGTRLPEGGPWERQWCHWCQQYGPSEHRGYRLLRLEISSGPDILGRDLVWDVDVEELARDSWEVTEETMSTKQDLQIPGAWVE